MLCLGITYWSSCENESVGRELYRLLKRLSCEQSVDLLFMLARALSIFSDAVIFCFQTKPAQLDEEQSVKFARLFSQELQWVLLPPRLSGSGPRVRGWARFVRPSDWSSGMLSRAGHRQQGPLLIAKKRYLYPPPFKNIFGQFSPSDYFHQIKFANKKITQLTNFVKLSKL